MGEKDYAKLGLFIVLAGVAIIATATFFIQRYGDRPTIPAVTYLDESVTGLSVGAPVRFRGVDVGRVDHLAIAGDQLLVEVGFQVDIATLERLHEAPAGSVDPEQVEVPVNMRVQKASSGITGLSYLLIDTPASPPDPLDLGFHPKADRQYIPSMPSDLEILLTGAEESISRLPQLLDRVEGLVTTMETTVQKSDIPGLVTDARASLRSITTQVDKVGNHLDGVFKEEGLLQTALADAQLREVSTTMIETMQLLGPRADATMAAVTSTATGIDLAVKEARLAVLSQKAEALLTDANGAVDETALAIEEAREVLPQVSLLLKHLQQMIRFLNDEPEALIFGPRQNEED